MIKDPQRRCCLQHLATNLAVTGNFFAGTGDDGMMQAPWSDFFFSTGGCCQGGEPAVL